MKYNYNPAASYQNGKNEGYIQGYAKGYAEARDKTTDIVCDAMLMAMAENGLEEATVQNIADLFSKYASMAWKCPEEYAVLKRKTFVKHQIEIDYGEKDAVEENEGS